MTDIRKKQDNRNAKTKKLQMNKETLKDLSISKRPGASPRGGAERNTQQVWCPSGMPDC